jgi:hypothetical protein
MALERKEANRSVKLVRRGLGLMLIYFLIALFVLSFQTVLAPLSMVPTQSLTPVPTNTAISTTPEPSSKLTAASIFARAGRRAFPPPPDRQRMLADLSRILGSIPFVSVMLGALAEFTPVLLALYLLRGNDKPVIRRLLNFSKFLVLVHFSIYVLPAMNSLLGVRWFAQADARIQGIFWSISSGQFLPFDLGLIYGGRYFGVAVLGILLPFVIRQWIPIFSDPVKAQPVPKREGQIGEDSEEEENRSVEKSSAVRRPWLEIIFFLLLGLCIVYPIYAIASSGVSLTACGDEFRDFWYALPDSLSQLLRLELVILTQGFACGVSILPAVILLVGALLALILFGLLKYGAGLLGLKIPSVWLWISAMLMLGLNVAKLPTFWGYESDSSVYIGEGRFWFVFVLILGLTLTFSLARASYFGLQFVMGWKKDLSPQGLWLALAVLVVFSVPTLGMVYADRPLGRLTDIYQLAYQLDNYLILLWLAAAGYVLYLDGESDLAIEGSSRKLALLSLGLFLFGLSPQFMYVPVAFLLGYLILEWATDTPALFEQPQRNADEFREWIRTFSLVRLSEQLYGGIRRENTKKLARGESKLADFLKNMNEYEDSKKEQEKLLPTHNDGSRIDPLAYGPYPTAWANGIHGLSWSLIFGLPWIVIYIFSFLAETEFNAIFPLLSFVEDLIILVGFWAAIGFVMGYFFPYLRGSSGLQKGLVLGLVLIVARMPLSFAYYRDFGDWQATLFLSMQIFIQCLLLGLLAFDFYVLNKWHFSFQQLLEIHGLSGMGIWLSSLGLALAAAITTLLSTEVQAAGILNLMVTAVGQIIGVDLSRVSFSP